MTDIRTSIFNQLLDACVLQGLNPLTELDELKHLFTQLLAVPTLCHFVYNRKSSAACKEKGEMCSENTVSGHVFCPRHEVQVRSSNTNIETVYNKCDHTIFDPFVGVIRIITKVDKNGMQIRYANLERGSHEAFVRWLSSNPNITPQ